MTHFGRWVVLVALVAAAGCGGDGANTPAPATPASVTPVPPPLVAPALGVYVTNETSGDLSVIDAATNAVIGTIPLGKRPRGIAASPDGTTLFIALSGSPAAPPGVDESKLPPPDRTADGIGVVDIASMKLVR
ncbi:MAG: hypothetical protein ABL961_16500, partial [Vicinamibacterales bacterium]